MFKKKPQEEFWVTQSTMFPSGTVIKTELGFFYNKGDKRFKVSDRAFKSWSFQRYVNVEEKNVQNKIAGKLGFREGSIVEDISTRKIYLISNNTRRQIVSPDTLTMLGATMSDVMQVSHAEILLHKPSENL